tara:strand:+ start:91 stop:561 length:471 start_codon:yes stop_codon:yes gene_type:complete
MQDYIEDNLFAKVIKATPLVSLDLVIVSSKGMLVGLRKNSPAKNYWFVPGGRIRKNESIDSAFQRITKEELGIKILKEKAAFLDYYEHFYEESFFSSDITTHYVVLAFLIEIEDIKIGNLPKTQHSKYTWFSGNLGQNEYSIHKYSMNYFNKLKKL